MVKVESRKLQLISYLMGSAKLDQEKVVHLSTKTMFVLEAWVKESAKFAMHHKALFKIQLKNLTIVETKRGMLKRSRVEWDFIWMSVVLVFRGKSFQKQLPHVFLYDP